MSSTRDMAIRQQNAIDNFIANVREQFGFTEREAETILNMYRKAKAVRLDWAMGRYSLTHGAFWERAPMERALELAKEDGLQKANS